MHRVAPVLAIGLMLVGLVWIGQGTGFLRGSSFMVDDVRWAIAGVLCLGMSGGMLAIRGRRGRPRRS